MKYKTGKKNKTVERNRYHMQGNILIVEDMEDQREILSEFIRLLGYKAASVGCGESALEFIEKHDVDIVILDVDLGERKDGLEIFGEYKSKKPSIKTILTSGHIDESRMQKIASANIDAYLQKPYLFKKFEQTLRKVMNN